jgi:hypothetical protein
MKAVGFLSVSFFNTYKGATIMSNMSENAKAPAGPQVLGMVLLSMGLYAMVLGLTVPLALLSWPGAWSNDASLGLLLLAVVLLVSGCLLILVSLLCLKVHWLLVIGLLLVALIAPYVQGRLFPADPAYWAQNWFLTFGVVVLVLSLILMSRVKGVWPALWRTLLVTAVSSGIIVAVAYVCAQVAAAGPGPINGRPPAGSPVYPIVSLLVGSLDVLIIVYWLTRKGIKLP